MYQSGLFCAPCIPRDRRPGRAGGTVPGSRAGIDPVCARPLASGTVALARPPCRWCSRVKRMGSRPGLAPTRASRVAGQGLDRHSACARKTRRGRIRNAAGILYKPAVGWRRAGDLRSELRFGGRYRSPDAAHVPASERSRARPRHPHASPRFRFRALAASQNVFVGTPIGCCAASAFPRYFAASGGKGEPP